MARIMGIQKPPFRTIEPNGAPIKNKITHDKDNATLL
jgi:hypothetical protein